MSKPRFYEYWLRALFPNHCPFCDTVVAMDRDICPTCRETVKRQSPPLCLRCGRSKAHCSCKQTKHKPSWDGAVSAFVYDDGVSGEAVRRLKDSGDRFAARVLGRELAQAIAAAFSGISFDCVMPAPMHPKDKLRRGYSQSEWIARAVAEELGIPFEDRLRKIRQTRSQKELSMKERRVNLRGAFDLDERFDAPDKTVLVIDDVLTTGSTLNESATILKIYGVRAVYVAAVCTTAERKETSYAGSETGD